MRLTPLHDDFGVMIEGIDLRIVTATSHYPRIREAFEDHEARMSLVSNLR